MSKIFLDPGHEGIAGGDPGAMGNGLREADITLAIGLAMRNYLLANYICEVRLARDRHMRLSLLQRTNASNAWGSDYYFSIHCNGFRLSSARGYEDFIHSSLSNTGGTAKMRNAVHPPSAKVWTDGGSPNRGKKKANFHVLRETKCPAILVENGFITNSQDANFLKKSSNIQKLAVAHSEGIAKALGLKKKEVKPVPKPPAPKPITPTPDTKLPLPIRFIPVKVAVNGKETGMELKGLFSDDMVTRVPIISFEELPQGTEVEIEGRGSYVYMNITVPEKDVKYAIEVLRKIVGIE